MTGWKWHSFPESIYLIFYSASDYRPDGIEYLAVDAHTFMEVEDFALANIPDGWQVDGIRKEYYDYAKMTGGENGELIDIKLNSSKEFPAEFLGYGNEKAKTQEVLKRKKFLKLVQQSFDNDKVAA